MNRTKQKLVRNKRTRNLCHDVFTWTARGKDFSLSFLTFCQRWISERFWRASSSLHESKTQGISFFCLFTEGQQDEIDGMLSNKGWCSQLTFSKSNSWIALIPVASLNILWKNFCNITQEISPFFSDSTWKLGQERVDASGKMWNFDQ